MKKILISACLLGAPVRYDGRSVPLSHPLISLWKSQGRLIEFCPEYAGGLAIPRPPAEICGGSGQDVIKGRAKVTTEAKLDITQPFLIGAEAALARVRAKGIFLALLKEKSPSCGVHMIYDGRFNKKTVKGRGVTTALLKKNGIKVFSENEIETLELLVNHNF